MAREMRLIDGDAIGKDILGWILCADPAEERIYKRLLDRLAAAPTITVKVAEKKKKTAPTAEETSLYQQIVDLYHSMCPDLPKVTKITDARRSALHARFEEIEEKEPGQIFATFRRLFEHVKASDFLQGKKGRGWRANFDWLMNPQNFAKVMGGTYDDPAPKAAQPMGNFDTDDFFEAALARSQERGA